MTDRPAICHLTSVHIPFDNRIFHKECRSLADAGYQVHLVARHDREETIDGIHIHPVRRRNTRLGRMLLSVWDVYRTARTVDAAIYHFHDPELIPAGVFLKISGKQVVEDVHEDYPDYIRHKEYLPPLLRRPLAWLVGLLEHATAGLFDGIITVVPVIQERFEPLNPRTEPVRNFPRQDELRTTGSAAEPVYHSDTPTAVYIGSLSRDRGLMQMIDAVERVNHVRPLTLVLGGSFAEPGLADEAASRPGWWYVDYRGFLDRPAVARALAEAVIGLVTLQPFSNYLESYPIKLFEYMGAGLPVVASDFPRWRQMVGDSGIMADPEDPQAIADAMLAILDNPEQARQMGQHGRQIVAERYSWETEAATLLALYETILHHMSR